MKIRRQTPVNLFLTWRPFQKVDFLTGVNDNVLREQTRSSGGFAHRALKGFRPFQKVYNFARFCRSPFRAFDERCNAEQILGHIARLAEKLDYEFIKDGDFYALVGKNDEAWTAAEVVPKFIAADLVNYFYRGLGGDLEAKRSKLTSFLRELEPHRKDLEHLSSSFTNDLFFLANNINIRHNNTTQQHKFQEQELQQQGFLYGQMGTRETLRQGSSDVRGGVPVAGIW